MDTLSAFAMGQAHKNDPHRVFDWHKAAELIRDAKPCEASAGLRGDWEYTGGTIYRDGKPVPQEETYVYLASKWAAPQLDMDGEIVECWLSKKDAPEGWDSGTYWPESALAILTGNVAAPKN